MSVRWCISLPLLLVLCSAQNPDCIPVQCGVLDRFNCATYNGTNPNSTFYTVNMYGCSNYTCFLLDFLGWRAEASNDTLPCSSAPDQMPLDEYIDCGPRPQGQLLASGDVFPVRCNSTLDCLLVNGNMSACACGLDGYKYCVPEIGSDVFDYLWSECENNRQITMSVWSYYASIQNYYPEYVSAPSCAQAIFQELIDILTFTSGSYLNLVVWYLIIWK